MRVFETYSEPSKPLREFKDSAEAVRLLGLGADPHGNGYAAGLSVWATSVMPRPERDSYIMTNGQWRETVRGCGLFWLHLGGVHKNTVTDSSLGWFTEAGARAKCTVTPGADTVDWHNHADARKRLTSIVRTLGVARAGKFPVLPSAAAYHARGHRLLYGAGQKREVNVGAA